MNNHRPHGVFDHSPLGDARTFGALGCGERILLMVCLRFAISSKNILLASCVTIVNPSCIPARKRNDRNDGASRSLW
jgi:hypothetical protein